MQSKIQEGYAFLKKNRVMAVAIAIILVFVLVRIPTLQEGYMNRDEPLYAWQSLVLTHNPELLFSAEMNTPYTVLLPMLAAPLNFFFEPLVSFRIITLIFSVVAMISIYFVSKEIFSQNAGLAAMVFVAFSPGFFYLSTKAMPDIPLIALSIIAFYLALKMNKKNGILLTLTLIAMYMIRPSSLVVTPPLFIFLIVKYRKLLQRKHIIAAGILFAIFLAVIFLFSPHKAEEVLGKTFIDGWNYGRFFLLIVDTVSWGIIGPLLATFAVTGAILERKKVTQKTGLLILWIFATALPFFVFKIWIIRYYILMIPAVASIAGQAVASLVQKKRYPVLIVLLVVSAALFYRAGTYATSYYTVDYDEKTFREEVLHDPLEQWFEDNPTNDKVIILGDEWPMRYVRLSVEKAVSNPREQIVFKPNQEEFEKALEESEGDPIVVLDDNSRFKEFWLYDEEFNGENYLKELGFEQQAEFKVIDIYYVYRKE